MADKCVRAYQGVILKITDDGRCLVGRILHGGMMHKLGTSDIFYVCCTVCVIISDQVVSEFSILLAFFAAMVSCIVFFSYCQQIDKVVNEFLLNFGRGFTLGHETRYRIGCFS